MNNEVLLDENAKNDWLKLVRKHKKKQKGLPALSTLNTNAGNVEHNIEMFNKMQGDSIPSVNPMNGVAEGNSCVGEAYTVVDSNENKKIVLEYENLAIDASSGYRDYYDTNYGWQRDYEEEEILVDWDYAVDEQDVIEFLQDNEEVQAYLGIQNLTDAEFNKQLRNNLDILVDRFENLLKIHFEEAAREDAEEKFEFREHVETTETSSVTLKEASKSRILDDKFDMSLRSLL